MSDEAESSKSSDRALEAAVRDALSRIDPESFDWQAYEGTYHGAFIYASWNVCDPGRSDADDEQVVR